MNAKSLWKIAIGKYSIYKIFFENRKRKIKTGSENNTKTDKRNKEQQS